ncbi:MAG: hypothetical protein K8L99_25675 [Anaerolineae bacterium]|nr:hypothetical protein [Anaerolineae bacterium]
MRLVAFLAVMALAATAQAAPPMAVIQPAGTGYQVRVSVPVEPADVGRKGMVFVALVRGGQPVAWHDGSQFVVPRMPAGSGVLANPVRLAVKTDAHLCDVVRVPGNYELWAGYGINGVPQSDDAKFMRAIESARKAGQKDVAAKLERYLQEQRAARNRKVADQVQASGLAAGAGEVFGEMISAGRFARAAKITCKEVGQ